MQVKIGKEVVRVDSGGASLILYKIEKTWKFLGNSEFEKLHPIVRAEMKSKALAERKEL